jgi:predicted metal-dependent hydrolase
MPSIIYKTQTIEFEVLRKAKMKNTYIQITPKGVLVKTNKSTSMKDINALLNKKLAWIVKHLEKMKAKKMDREVVNGSQIYYLGERYEVEMKEDNSLKSVELLFINSKFLISMNSLHSQEELLLAIDMFYKQKAIEKITVLVEEWSKEMSLVPTFVGYRKAKTRWGSCSGRDRISFNYYLMRLPLSCIEYVVVHELAHIKHKNHSVHFWALVQDYLDDYKSREREIKTFEKLI